MPAVPEVPVSKPGDLWLLSDHRLLAGDSTKAEDVQRLMAGERAGLMATDPPYLCDYDGGNRPQTWAKDGRRISSEEKTRHWDDYVDHDTSVAFTGTSCAWQSSRHSANHHCSTCSSG